MEIRGLIKFSLVDYPGKMSCVVFAGRCNFRCPYCHNPHLVLNPESQPEMRRGEFLSFLRGRRGRLDGVVLSGGEPTLHSGTPDFLRDVKSLGFLAKLDTNGAFPERAKAMVEDGLVDMLGVDYKAPAASYADVAGLDDADIAEKVRSLIAFAVERGLPMDVRTTVHRGILSFDDLATMRKELDAVGVDEWFLQQFHPAETLDPSFEGEATYSDLELLEIAKRLGGGTKVRGVKIPESRYERHMDEARSASTELVAR